MSEHYDFHYQPTGSGAISGQQVLEQTEDAINELGDYVNDNVGGAMDVAQQALETAQNAEQDAQTALDTANSFSDAIQSAQQDASTALSTAQTAQTTASNANNTAIQAQQDASSAVTTANNASGQVNTLSGTVIALGQRVTTAEGNIGQNTSDITALTTRVGTAEGNITTLQNDVTIAQGNASSAMATAGQVKQQAYVFRYSSTALVASSTNSNALLDNTDNLKVGDKVIDSSGVLFSVTAIDTANSTFTIGTALIDLAQDSDVVHKSEAENITGKKTFLGVSVNFKSSVGVYGSTSGNASINMYDKNSMLVSYLRQGLYNNGLPYIKIALQGIDENNQTFEKSLTYSWLGNVNQAYFRSETDNFVYLGTENNKWKSVYATNYYYGSNNVEFSQKFVTTDTNQTIGGTKDFSDVLRIYNSNSSLNTAQILLKNSKVNRGQSVYGDQAIWFRDATDKPVTALVSRVTATGGSALLLYVYNVDQNNQQVTNFLSFVKNLDGTCYLLPDQTDVIEFGSTAAKFKNVNANKFNGVEPSSLSLPSGNVSDVIDISSYLVNLDGTDNTYVAPANGWITINMNNCSGIHATITGFWGDSRIRASAGAIKFLMPVLKNQTVTLTIHGGTINNARFIPCQGNV